MFATHFPTMKSAWYVKFSEVEHLPICIESFMTTAEPIFNKKTKKRNLEQYLASWQLDGTK